MRRVFLQNFGCQMNDYDVERMQVLLRADGWEPAASMDEADLVVFNSCAIREKAEHKLVSEAGRLRELKSARPGMIVAIGGCVAQQEGGRLLKRPPVAD